MVMDSGLGTEIVTIVYLPSTHEISPERGNWVKGHGLEQNCYETKGSQFTLFTSRD
jgi:hypothetical protein